MVGELLSNTYRITRLIGRGGMGEVYEATHERTGAPFAIKILLADFSGKEDLLARFQREAEITSRLRHPNIVKVFDFDKLPDGRPFLIMEYLYGHPLDAIIVRGHPMPIARVASMIDQIALGLAAAHDAGVVHRDLKPGNLFVEQLAGSDRELLRVLDFGISKIRDSGHLTRTSTIMGTPHYMSPEQALGRSREIDARSDQFALAAIAYELVTGRLAFGADDPDNDEIPAIVYRVVHVEPPSFASLGVDLPGEIEAVVRTGLAKNAAERFPSVSAFGRAFARATRKLVDEARDDDAPAPPPSSRNTLFFVGGTGLPTPSPPTPVAKTTPLPKARPESLKTTPLPPAAAEEPPVTASTGTMVMPQAGGARETKPMPTTLGLSVGETAPPKARMARRKLLPVVALTGGAVAAGLVAWLALAGGRGDRKPATAPADPAAAMPTIAAPPPIAPVVTAPPPPPVADEKPAAPAAPPVALAPRGPESPAAALAEPSTVTFKIEGAREPIVVKVDGKTVPGAGPIKLPRDQAMHTIRVSSAHFIGETFTKRADADRTLHLKNELRLLTAPGN